MTKKLGFNMARKHVKVEPARWYYWCDKLGLLVWQDMPAGDYRAANDESKANFRRGTEGHDRHAPQPPLHRHVGALQRRLGPARHAARSPTGSRSYDPTPAGQQRQRLDRQAAAARFPTCTTIPGPGMRPVEDEAGSRAGRVRRPGPAGWPATPGRAEKNWGYVSFENAAEADRRLRRPADGHAPADRRRACRPRSTRRPPTSRSRSTA